MARYTDDDVKRIRETGESSAFWLEMAGFKSQAHGLRQALKPFKPDPWDEFHQFRISQWGVLELDTTKALIDKAVELGLVKRVDDDA